MRVGMLGTVDHINLFAPEATASPDVDFVGIAEGDAEVGEPLAERCGTRLFPTVEALLSEKLDAVGIFTPFHEKVDHIVACIEQGLHVITDKPAATNLQGLFRIRKALASRPGLVFTMGLTLRASPEYLRIKALVDAGAVGRIVQINARRAYRLRRPTRPEFMFDSAKSGGIWVELAVHDVDCVRWITGEEYLSVTATHGNVSSPGEPYQDHGSGLFTMTGGLTAFLEHNRLVPSTGDGADNRLHIVGSDGVIDMGPEPGITVWNGGRERGPDRERPPKLSMFRNFLDAIGNGGPLIAPTDDVLRATEVALTAYASATEGTGKAIHRG